MKCGLVAGAFGFAELAEVLYLSRERHGARDDMVVK
jgi:hypothetical protein